MDFARPRHMYFGEGQAPGVGGYAFEWGREGLYGLGYSYAWTMAEEQDDVDRTDIRRRVEEKEFDLVVFGSVHRGMPFFEDVMKHYGKEDIVFVDGEDIHRWCTKSKELVGKGWYFMREIPEGCPSDE